MPIFVSTSCLRGGRDALTVIRKFVASGIRHIEIGSAHASTTGLNELLAIPGLSLAAHGDFGGRATPRGASLFSPDAELREAAAQQVEESLRLCAALGAAMYTFHPAAPGMAAVAWDDGVEALKRIAAVAGEVGVGLGVENVHYGEMGGPTALNRADRLLELLDRVSMPALKILIDLGHLKLAAARGEVNPIEFIRALAPFALAVHVHDNNGLSDGHLPVREGSDAASWLALPELRGLPLIVETTRQSMDDILGQISVIERITGRNTDVSSDDPSFRR